MYHPPMDTKILEHFKSFLIHRENCCQATVDSYIHSVKLFTEFCRTSGGHDPLDLSDQELAFELLIGLKLSRKSRKGGQGWSQEMTYKTGAIMSKFYKFAIRFKYKTSANPFPDGPGIKRAKRKAPPYIPWDHEDMKRVLSYPKTARDKAMVWVMFSGGMRCEEIVNLKIENLLQNRVFSFTGKGNKVRSVPICAQAHLFVNLQIVDLRRRGYTGPWLFPKNDLTGPMTTGGFLKYVKRMGKALGIPHIHPHLFRHSYASHYAKYLKLQHLAELLGHADIKTTMIYTHILPETLHLEHSKYSVPFPEMETDRPRPLLDPSADDEELATA